MPASLQAHLKSFHPCTHCGTPHHELEGMAFVTIPTLTLSEPHTHHDWTTFEYHFVCSRNCEMQIVRGLSIPEEGMVPSPLQHTLDT